MERGAHGLGEEGRVGEDGDHVLADGAPGGDVGLAHLEAVAGLVADVHAGDAGGQMLAAVELAQTLGFPQLKMYFMVGHPTENDDDIHGIIDLTLKARAIFRRNIAINATPFVPKAHTPFQWMAMTPAKTLQARQKTLQRALARHGIEVSADSPEWAEVQGVLALSGLRVEGLMTMAPLTEASEETRPVFASLRGLRDVLREHFPQQPWGQLSMGMTDDFEGAIEEGATLVRIGRAIFQMERV